MDQSTNIGETEGLKTGLELVKSVSDKHLDLLRPSARYSISKAPDTADREKGRYTLIRDPEDFNLGFMTNPSRALAVGFLLGFVFPLMWYYGTFLYFGNHCRKDPRERAGLAASAIAAMACSVVMLVIVVFRLM